MQSPRAFSLRRSSRDRRPVAGTRFRTLLSRLDRIVHDTLAQSRLTTPVSSHSYFPPGQSVCLLLGFFRFPKGNVLQPKSRDYTKKTQGEKLRRLGSKEHQGRLTKSSTASPAHRFNGGTSPGPLSPQVPEGRLRPYPKSVSAVPTGLDRERTARFPTVETVG